MNRIFLCLVLGFVVLAVGSPLRAQQVELEFKNPPKAFRPMVRWWWPGGDVASAELRKEIDQLDQAGFGGAEIQPFNWGLKPDLSKQELDRVNDYLTPTFFTHVTAALQEARKNGMWLDYTFGSGWPFGGAGVVTPELAAVELREAHQTIRGPVHFHARIAMPQLSASVQAEFAKLPQGWAERFKRREKLVAVVAVRGSSVTLYSGKSSDGEPQVRRPGMLHGTPVVLTNHMQPDGTLDWDVPPGVWQVFTFKEMPTGQEVIGGLGAGPHLVLDHMSRHAFDVYAQRVGGQLRKYDGQYFGNGLRAVFCDSLEVRAYLYWDDHFLEQFRKLRGYDLTPYLPLLKVPGEHVPYYATAAGLPLYNIPGIGNRVRRDYWQTVSDVMIRNFYEPFNQWAHQNHLLTRVQAHGSPTDLLRVYGEADIPETEDLYANGRYDFMKMASSGGDLYGRKIVSSESFVWHGSIYQTTPEKIKRLADKLLTAGINEIVYHGFPYRRMDRPFPGWDPFQLRGAFSSDVNSTNPFFSFLPRLNGYITRLQYISQTGKTVVPVALYRGGLAYPYMAVPQPEPEIDTHLMDAGYNFDHIDASVLLLCHVNNGKLVSPGGEQYSALVIPDLKAISSAAADQISRFASEGLPVIFVHRIPEVAPGVEDGHPQPGLVQTITVGASVQMAANPEGAVKALIKASVQPNLHFDGPALPFIEKRLGALNAFFLRNPNDVPVELSADFPSAGAPELWDPWNGKIRLAPHFARHGHSVRVNLHIAPYGSALLVFDPANKTEASPPVAPTRIIASEPIGQEGWKLHGVGIGPGSKPETIDLSLKSLADWTLISELKNFSGRVEYTTSFNVPSDWLAQGHHIILDLGDVKDAATVSINGREGPELLLRPYKGDVTALVHAGSNTLQVTVVNTLFNALSAQGPSEVFAHETTNRSDGLMPSGLIGPVVLREVQ